MSSAVPHGLVAAELAADVGCVIAPPIFKIPAAAASRRSALCTLSQRS